MIYWRGINIGDWQFYEEIANIKSTNFFPQANPLNITPVNKSSCTVLLFIAIIINIALQCGLRRGGIVSTYALDIRGSPVCTHVHIHVIVLNPSSCTS